MTSIARETLSAARPRGALLATFLALAWASHGCVEDDRTFVEVSPTTSNVPGALRDTNLIEFHATFTKAQSELCVTCHGAMLDRQTLDPARPEFHRLKLAPGAVLAGWVCTDCHERVDLVSASGGNTRTQVNVEGICYQCHQANVLGRRLYATKEGRR